MKPIRQGGEGFPTSTGDPDPDRATAAGAGESLDESSNKEKFFRPSRQSIVVLLVGLLITAGFAFLASTVNNRNENRLLLVQVREAGTVLAGAVSHTASSELASTWRLCQDWQRFWQWLMAMR